MKRIKTDAFASELDKQPELQLALDEALLLMANEGTVSPSLRTWSFSRTAVVLGRSSKVAKETDRTFCDQHQIPIFRRCSGGASIVGGPGCLMYSVVLSTDDHPEARKIDAAHELVMSRVLAAVRRQLPEVQLQGICDLTFQDRKFSGNALRITRQHLLYHGTILHDGDLELISNCLDFAPRQPDYREGRKHIDFVTNAPLQPARLTADLASEFGATDGTTDGATDDGFSSEVIDRARQLAADRYSRHEWSFRH